MNASLVAAVMLAAVAVLSCGRLLLWWRDAPRGERSAPWRLALLLAAQPLSAALLHLALFPPSAAETAGTLVVATRDAPRLLVIRSGERLVVLPEAPTGLGGEPTPDLATALRRHPGARRLRVVGAGLEPRDREAAAGRALSFGPPPLPRGLVELRPPPSVAPGAAFTTAGRVNGVGGGSVELLDPAGRVVDVRPLPPSGEFALAGAAGTPGPALFAVRVRDRARTEVETADLPVEAVTSPPIKALLLAGAAGPEVRALRRWAADAGVELRASVAAGAGLELGERPPTLDAATLDRLDLVVVDERSWAALRDGERAALVAAVRRGLGLLMRVTGPVPRGVRAQWEAVGPALGDGEGAAAVRLPAPSTRDGEPGPPELTRRLADVASPDAPALLRDGTDAVLGRWRALGQGRAGVWAVTDSSGLTTSGFGDRYGELWSAMVSRLARAGAVRSVTIETPPREGRRVSVCGVPDGTVVLGPSAARTILRLDPAAGGCAGYWPRGPGWRAVRPPGGADGRDTLFYVRPAAQAPGLVAQDDRSATEALVRPAGDARAATRPAWLPEGGWSAFLTWLLLSVALWLFERTPWGRPRPTPPADLS